MDSNRKRGRKRHVEENLIEKGSGVSPNTEISVSSENGSEVMKSRTDSYLDIQNEEKVDKALAKQKEKTCCGIVNSEKIRLYVITISTFFFAFISISFGVFLLKTTQPQFHSVRGGIIAVVIGIILLVPACYGITGIVTKVAKKKSRTSKSTKEEPVGLTVSSYLDV